MDKMLCASMMCADSGRLGQEAAELERAGIDMFHIDIMDGSFVPNFAMGFGETAFLGRTAGRPLDAHLMIYNPANYVSQLAEMGVSIIYIHPEADVHTPRTLQKIRDAGAAPGICLNPATTAESVLPLLGLCDYVMVMAVNPGFAGQQPLPFTDEKTALLASWRDRFTYTLVVDGACTPARIASLSAAGADGFVLGMSALFGQNRPYADIITELRAL